VLTSIIICIIIGLGIGWVLGTLWNRIKANSLLQRAHQKLSQVEEEIRNRKREIELERKEELHRIRVAFEKESREKRDELTRLSKRLIEREENLDRRFQELEKKTQQMVSEKQKLEEERENLRELENEYRLKLEKIAGISSQEAKKLLLENIKKEAKEEAVKIIQETEKEAKEVANKRGRFNSG